VGRKTLTQSINQPIKRGSSFSRTFQDLDQIPGLSRPGKCEFKNPRTFQDL